MEIDTERLGQDVDAVLDNVVKHEIKIPWRSHVRSFGFGDRRSTRPGTGNDFDTFRDMERGDDPRRMSARLFASTRKRMVRVDRPETQIYAYVLVDIRQSMRFGSKRVTKLQLAAELAASCIVSLDKTKDRCGYMLFSGTRLEDMMSPKIANYTQAYLAVTSILSTQPSAPSADDKASGLSEALAMAIPKRSLIFLISDFIGYTAEDWKALEEAAGLHDVVCLHVEDEREQKLPDRKYSRWFGWLQRWFPTLYALQDWTGQTRYIWDTEKNRTQYAANHREFKSALQARFHHQFNCRWLVVNTKEGEAAYPSLIQAFGGAR